MLYFENSMTCQYKQSTIILEDVAAMLVGIGTQLLYQQSLTRQIFDVLPRIQAYICGLLSFIAPILSFIDNKIIIGSIGIVLELIYALVLFIHYNKQRQIQLRIVEVISGGTNIILSFLNQYTGQRNKNCIIQYFHPIPIIFGVHYIFLQITWLITIEVRKKKYLQQLKSFPNQTIEKFQKYSMVYPQLNQFKYNKYQLPDIEKQGLQFSINQSLSTNQLIQYKEKLYQYKNRQLIYRSNGEKDQIFEPLATIVFEQAEDDNDYFEKYLEIARLFVLAYCKPKVVFIIEVPRIAVLVSVARKLQQTPMENHCYQLYCKFQGEKGADLSGLTKEMFSIMDKELFELSEQEVEKIKNMDQSKLIQKYSNKIGPYSKSQSLLVSDNNLIMINQYINPYYAYTIGWYLGKALFQNVTINSNVTMNAPITIDDVQDYDEYFGRFLRLAQEDKEQLDTLIDLLPDLKYKIITIREQNKVKQMYSFDVRQAVELHYFGQQTVSLVKLKQGFDSVFPRENIYFLNPQFVCKKIKASQNIDIDDWEKYTVVNRFPDGCEVVQNFWELMHQDQKLAQEVLQFSTGLKYPPYGGFKTLGNPNAFMSQYFNIQPTNPENYPNSQTCTNTIRLPCINDKNELKRRLLDSLQYQSIENP